MVGLLPAVGLPGIARSHSGLDFNSHQTIREPGQDVDLSPTRPNVAADDYSSTVDEIASGEFLTEAGDPTVG